MKHVSEYTKSVTKNLINQGTVKMTPKEKREYWDRIKRELPDFAEFCIELDKKMGKPERVIVEKWPKDTTY